MNLSLRLIGFGASLVLTLVAFFIVVRPAFFHLGMKAAVVILLILAILQTLTQAICFLHLLSEKGTRWNLVVFISTISIILIIIVGSIWIMNHLNYNMMHAHSELGDRRS